MSLSKSIVIVNEFTTKTNDGGSRGATPGQYVNRYMARADAVEPIITNNSSINSYVKRYMARADAVDVRKDLNEVKTDVSKISKYGGVAFGNGEISLTDEQLDEISEKIQQGFDSNKTVLKTVISFDEQYLKQNKIVDKNFKCLRDGDYKGNIDQMKLRRGIINGIEKLRHNFNDLQYVGVIQVDTKHVHCHLAMFDAGVGRLMSDGKQSGFINSKMKHEIRRGIDNELDSMKSIRRITKNIQNEKRNVKSFIKKYSYEMMNNNGFYQLLFSVLPENKNYWRASSNRKDMKRADILVTEFVTQLLNREDSGFTEAMAHVKEYAYNRYKKEGLEEFQYKNLITNGENKIIQSAKDSVYNVLKKIHDKDKIQVDKLDSKLIELLSLDLDELEMSTLKKTDNDIFVFSYKLRSYSNRLRNHRDEKNKYRDLRKHYEKAMRDGQTSDDSKVLFDFYKFEEEYNDKCMTKYQHFLKFLPPQDEYMDEYFDLMRYKKRKLNMKRMLDDKDMKKMDKNNAEKYGREVYGLNGGKYHAVDPNVLINRYIKMLDRYDDMEDEFLNKLNDNALDMKDDKITDNLKYDFDDVKYLDIHHMLFDFDNGFSVSLNNINKFRDVANTRFKLVNKAVEYLQQSYQDEDFSNLLPLRDINAMKKMSDKLYINPYVEKPKLSKDMIKSAKSKKISKLDVDVERTIRTTIKTMIENIDFEHELS